MSAAKKPSSSKPSASKASADRAGSKGKTVTKKTTAKKSAARKTPTKSSAKKSSTKKIVPRKSTAAKSPARSAAKPKASGSGRAKTTAGKSAARRSARSRPRPVKLDAKALDKIRKQLMEERAAYEAQMTEVEAESFQGTQSELTGEVGIDEDFADAGSATFDREQALSIQNNIRDLIDQVDRALERINEGTYGLCERCGRPIDAARLKALPRTLLCTDCKRREERSR
jgi:RNA polymerase-binding protein DksA